MIDRGCVSVSFFLLGILLLGYFLKLSPFTLYDTLIPIPMPATTTTTTTAAINDNNNVHAQGNDHVEGFDHGNDHGHGFGHGNDHGHGGHGYRHGNDHKHGNDYGHGGHGNDHGSGEHGNDQGNSPDPEIQGHSKYWVTLLNECPATVFFGVSGPTSVSPYGGDSWMAESGQSISIHLPLSWLSTEIPGKRRVVGPRFWARTGCKYDLSYNKAQCETGDCGNFVDCSSANLAGRAPTSLAEFCFECGDGYTYYDISLVDGYTVGIDILPGDPHSSQRPGDPTNPFWCKSDLCMDSSDIRTDCPEIFSLYNSDLSMYNGNDLRTKIACFSNCGKYEYPNAPLANCDDTDYQCKNWRKYCCQADSYGKPCETSLECSDGGACWNGTCECRPYYLRPPCSSEICTNPDGMPSPAICSEIDCVGDDTLHQKCPRAYTWPNDPQTYSCDATTYTIRFCPGGSTEPITPSTSIPLCSELNEELFDWDTAQIDCSESHGKYMCAVKRTDTPNIWACDVDMDSCGNILCQWDGDD